ncbi:MAG TPA: alpha/beta hydrolase [Mobilitalea sp.]|nr:alpha/beta hydrolase [Mobilitalea sp.]
MPYQQVDDCSIFYEDIGIGDPILFLHSGYSRGIIAFSGQIQPFFHSYRCLMPDFRGHGRTISESKDWDTPIIAEDMAGFLDALQIRRAHLIGYSLGGGVALHMAVKRPDLVRSMITIGCGGAADPDGADDFEPEALMRNNQNKFIERMKILHSEAHGGDWQHHMRQSTRDWRMYPCLSEQDWTRLTMPMLLIGGENDSFASPQRLLKMQERCPQAEIWSVPNGGHRPHMPTEQVKEVNKRMLDFLKTIN